MSSSLRLVWFGALLIGASGLQACSSSSGGSTPNPSDPANDGVQNGDETGVDCGGSRSKKCAIGEGCGTGGDCASTSCVQRVCRNVSSSNGIKDGSETDVDCGGSSAAPKCGGDKRCAASSDCISAVCNDGKCEAPNPRDGVKNGDETDVDCGGSVAPTCGAGLRCAAPNDCSDAICTAGQCVLGTHSDGVRNAGESGTDCGGTAPLKCAVGQSCNVGADCTQLSCVSNLCAAPSFSDNVKNGVETDVDCGGDPAHPCADNRACAAPSDCTSARCVSNVCVPASHSDGLKNLGETDVDCGGSQADAAGQAARCGTDKTCALHADCASDGCNAATLKCALAPSCAQSAGGETCGKGETGDPTHVHESCCSSVRFTRAAAQGGNFAVDKYLVTAGRMRQFLERVGGDVRGYMRGSTRWSEYNDKWGNALTDHLPTNLAEAEAMVARGQKQDWEWETQSHKNGPSDPDYRAYEISGFGCYDAHTYHQAGDPYTRAYSDEKVLNCVHAFMLDAMCMWDGGQLWDESMGKYVWNGGSGNNRKHPWGDTPVPLLNTPTAVVRYWDDPNNPVHEYLVHKWNYPYVGNELSFNPAYVTNGNAYQLPPPGRRPKGYARPLGVLYSASNPLNGVADMTGVLYQMNWRGATWTTGSLYTGSYEVHDQGTYGDSFDWVRNRRYAAAGGRCAR